MAGRFRDRNYDRRERGAHYPYRGDHGRGDYPDRSYRDYGRTGPRFGDRSTFRRDEGYFGGDPGEGYGRGYDSYEPNRAFGSSWRDSTGYSNYDYPERRYDRASRRAGFGRDAYNLGYDDEGIFDEARRWDHNRGYDDRDRYETGYTGQTSYHASTFPSSERGFYTDRERGRDRSWWDRAADEVSSWFGDEQAERRRRMDERRGFRGRGPKNYTRSDDRIKEDVNDRLTDYDYIDASDIEVAVKSGDVVLSGTVDSRYEKRLAEDIAEDVTGVNNVENRLRIRREQQQFAGGEWAYADTAGHTELNRTETAATHGETSETETGKARGTSSSG